MGWFSKKTDPIQSRAHALDAEIATLESKIRKLNAQIEKTTPAVPAPTTPRLRTSVQPAETDIPHRPSPTPASMSVTASAAASQNAIEVDLPPTSVVPVPVEIPAHYNSHGVRKFDLLGALQRFRKSLTGPEPSNPKLVTYLAAGNIHGLRPLRYEQRVARNRFIVLCFVLLGILFAIFKLLIPSL